MLSHLAITVELAAPALFLDECVSQLLLSVLLFKHECFVSLGLLRQRLPLVFQDSSWYSLHRFLEHQHVQLFR